MLVQGTTIFNTALTTFDTYQGQPTEKYALQITLDKKEAARLTKEGVVIKEYEGEPIRKFTSRYDIPVFTAKNEKWHDEIPSGSTVRIEYTTKEHPTAGQVPYAKRVLLMEVGEGYEGQKEADEQFFSDIPA